MGLDYILNIYCYSESHASCEANHQVKQNNKCQASGALYLSDAYNMTNLQQELTKLGQC